jgi:transposase
MLSRSLASTKPRWARSRRTSESRKSCLAYWLKKADVEEGVKRGLTEKESAELREAKKRIRLLEQEAEVMRRAVAYLSRDVNPK